MNHLIPNINILFSIEALKSVWRGICIVWRFTKEHILFEIILSIFLLFIVFMDRKFILEIKKL